MTFYAHKLKDKRPPIASKIAIYTFPGKGAIDTQEKSKTYNINNNTVDDSIKVWGKIGIETLSGLRNLSNSNPFAIGSRSVIYSR